MAAMNCSVVIRQSLFFFVSNHPNTRIFLLPRFLPFSTTSAGCLSPESSAKPPPAAGFCEPKQNSPATPEKSSMRLDGLPFDSIWEDHGIITLTRKTKDEIIDIEVTDDIIESEFRDRIAYESHSEMYEEHWMSITILYGDNFKKCVKFDVVATIAGFLFEK